MEAELLRLFERPSENKDGLIGQRMIVSKRQEDGGCKPAYAIACIWDVNGDQLFMYQIYDNEKWKTICDLAHVPSDDDKMLTFSGYQNSRFIGWFFRLSRGKGENVIVERVKCTGTGMYFHYGHCCGEMHNENWARR